MAGDNRGRRVPGVAQPHRQSADRKMPPPPTYGNTTVVLFAEDGDLGVRASFPVLRQDAVPAGPSRARRTRHAVARFLADDSDDVASSSSSDSASRSSSTSGSPAGEDAGEDARTAARPRRRAIAEDVCTRLTLSRGSRNSFADVVEEDSAGLSAVSPSRGFCNKGLTGRQELLGCVLNVGSPFGKPTDVHSSRRNHNRAQCHRRAASCVARRGSQTLLAKPDPFANAGIVLRECVIG